MLCVGYGKEENGVDCGWNMSKEYVVVPSLAFREKTGIRKETTTNALGWESKES